MTGLLEGGIGLEKIATGALIVLIEDLNDCIEAEEAKYSDEDETLDHLRDRPYTPVTLEKVALEDFYLGNVPSLIEESTPLDRYPNVASMAYRAAKAVGDASNDHAEEFQNVLYIEALVKASPSEGEEICDKRIWRTVEAIHAAISKDRSLRGRVYEMEGTPTVIVSEVFSRPKNANEGHGEDWFWQAARIEYIVNQISPFEYDAL